MAYLGSLSPRQGGSHIKTKLGQQRRERFKECIKVIHPIMPSDSGEKLIQKERGREGRDTYSLPIAFGQLRWLPWRLPPGVSVDSVTWRTHAFTATSYHLYIVQQD